MTTPINSFQDILDAMERDPALRDALRRYILTEEILALPQQVKALTEAVEALVSESLELSERSRATQGRGWGTSRRTRAASDRIWRTSNRSSATQGGGWRTSRGSTGTENQRGTNGRRCEPLTRHQLRGQGDRSRPSAG